MIHYNNQLYAFGGPGKKNGSNLAPFSAFYESVNNGITWQQVKDMYSSLKNLAIYTSKPMAIILMLLTRITIYG